MGVRGEMGFMKKKMVWLLLVLFVISNGSPVFADTIEPVSVNEKIKLSKDPNYKIIYNGLKQFKPYVNVKLSGDFNTSYMRAYQVLYQVMEDHPEIYYFDYRKAQIWSDGKFELGYISSPKTLQVQTKKMNDTVNKIVKGVNPKWSTYQKIKYLHDYVVNSTSYDYENYIKGTIPASSYNAYGTLVNKKAVCNGYALAMKLLLDRVNIKNYIVVGEAKGVNSWERKSSW